MVCLGLELSVHEWEDGRTTTKLEEWQSSNSVPVLNIEVSYLGSSVTRLGNLLDFGQLFKAFGNNYFVQISYILTHFL